MKHRIAYNIVTGEVFEAHTSKKTFHNMLTCIKRDDRKQYGVSGRWVFRNPWGCDVKYW